MGDNKTVNERPCRCDDDGDFAGNKTNPQSTSKARAAAAVTTLKKHNRKFV